MDMKHKHFIQFVCFLYSAVITCVAQDSFYFNETPEEKVDVIENTEILLRCDVSDRRHIVFSWTLDGKPIANTTRRFQDGRNLRILRVSREEDKGAFQCSATNATTRFSRESLEAYLNIQWISPVAEVELKKPEKEQILQGSEIIFKCNITGNPLPSYTWYHNKFRLFNSERRTLLDEDTKLKIEDIKISDNGIYSCHAENVAGSVDSTDNFLLNIFSPAAPQLVVENFTRVLLTVRGASARLDCPFIGATRVDWFTTFEKLKNSSRYTVLNNGSLYFPMVRMSDEKSYRCEGIRENSPSQIFSVELQLAVLGDITPDTFEPRLIPTFPLVIPVDEPFQVKTFPPKGKPPPLVRWLDKNGMPISESGNIRVSGTNLLFDDPDEQDSGNYTFIVSNAAGERRKSVWIIISVPPFIRKAPRPTQIEEGQKVVFSCSVDGTPFPVTKIWWLKNDTLIQPNLARHSVNKVNGTLEISDVKLSDKGEYACVANTTGHPIQKSSKAFLTVKKKLKFKPLPQNQRLELHSQARVNCVAEGESRVVIRWLKDGDINFDRHITEGSGVLYFNGVKSTDAGRYTCVAHSPTQGKFINATIYIKIVVSPKFTITPRNVTTYEGQSVMIHCMASGFPRPEISWEIDSQTDTWDFSRIKELPNGTLSISKVYMADTGKYTCTAKSDGSEINVEAYMLVRSAAEKEGEESFNMMKTIIIAVCSAGAYLALVIGLTAYCSYRLILQRRSRKAMGKYVKTQNGNLPKEQHELLMKERESGTHLRSDSDNRSHASGMSSSQPSHSSQSTTTHSRSRRGSYERLQFPRTELQTLGMLGKGMFGDVFLAKARNIKHTEPETLVVVKSLLAKDEHTFFEFRQEMDMLSKLDHPNVIRLMGVCREMEPQFMITEYCDWGDLKQFLLATRTDNNGRFPSRLPPLNMEQKLIFCNQVAMGMEHISTHRFVHRDLAARNVLLTSRLELKVSLLSLSRDVYAGEYYKLRQNVIPLRWMPPEALDDDFSTKSDVWSFGVFMWEVFHLGDLPYRIKSDEDIVTGLKLADISLEFASHCPTRITDIIQKCTLDCPRDRPLFSELCSLLSKIMTDCSCC